MRHHVNPLSDRSEYSFNGFGNDRPIFVDIGADRGEFSAGLIANFGDTYNYIVLEIRQPLAQRLEERFAHHENVVVFAGDAVRNLRSLLLQSIVSDGARIATIYINFPDPWFKDRHHKRRVLCKRLLDDVRLWMPLDTEWVYQTDQKMLFDDTIELLQCEGFSRITFFDEPPHNIRTKWEKAKIVNGDRIYRMQFTLQS